MNYDLINAYFDELDKAFQRELAAQGRNDKKHPGFDQMIWFVKAWSKITLNIKGGSARKPAAGYLQERTGAPVTQRGGITTKRPIEWRVVLRTISKDGLNRVKRRLGLHGPDERRRFQKGR